MMSQVVIFQQELNPEKNVVGNVRDARAKIVTIAFIAKIVSVWADQTE